MKYVKPVIAAVMVIVTAAQFFLYGFLGEMIWWLVYSLLYFGAALYQRFHAPSLRSHILTFVYIFLPLAGIVGYAAAEGFSRLTVTFYIIFMISLAAALLWEIVCIALVAKDRSDEKNRRRRQ